MSRHTLPREALQNYFDELLADDIAPVTQRIEQQHRRAAALVEEDREKQRKLEKLLQSVVSPAPVVMSQPEPVIAPLDAEKPAGKVEEIQSWDIDIATPDADVTPEEALDSGVTELTPEIESPSEGAVAESNYTVDGLQWASNGLPQWAQKEFDVLLFQVSGLTLAVPLVSLGQIQPLTDELTPLFGQADWFMGLLPTPTGKVRTVNTAKFVMPERYDEAFLETAKYVISIDGVPWGLAVDSVNQPITLKPDDVKWRSERSKRPWLAGTVKEHMCALLDVPRIGQLLMEADRNTQRASQQTRHRAH